MIQESGGTSSARGVNLVHDVKCEFLRVLFDTLGPSNLMHPGQTRLGASRVRLLIL